MSARPPSPDRKGVEKFASPTPDHEGASGFASPIPDRNGAGESAPINEPVADARGSDQPGRTYRAVDGPGAYFITFTTYGSWLPGDKRSFVDREHNCPDEPRLPAATERHRLASQLLKHPPITFNVRQRQKVLEAILEVCRCRGWWAHAVDVRTNHVHCIVSAAAAPEKVMNDFKAYATRGLRRSGLLERSINPVWTEHGSTRYLWNDAQFHGAMIYVRDEQGERLGYGEGPIPTSSPGPDH